MVITNLLPLLSVCEPESGALSLYMHPRQKYVNYPMNRNIVRRSTHHRHETLTLVQLPLYLLFQGTYCGCATVQLQVQKAPSHNSITSVAVPWQLLIATMTLTTDLWQL